jgi:hypothetical protein
MLTMVDLFGWFRLRKKKVELLPLDPETIRKDKIIKALTQENQGLKASFSKVLAEKREEKENEIKEDRELILREKLQEEEKLIKEKRYGNSLSLNKFFYAFLNDSKFRDKLEVCSYDDKIAFGKFGQFLILESGDLAITDSNNNILSHGRNLDMVIYKPGSLFNQIKRGRILIPYDTDFNYYPDIDEVEINDVLYDENQKIYKETEVAKRKAKDLLLEKDKELRERYNYTERLENLNINLTKELSDVKNTLKFLKKGEENMRTELSQVMNASSQFNIVSGEMQRKITDLTELKSLYESTISKYENVIKDLLDKIEEAGDKTTFQRAMELVKDTIDYSKTRLPQKEVIREIEKKEEVPVRPIR